MAVLTRPCAQFPCLRKSCRSAASRNGLIIKTTCSAIKTQLCTIAISLTLFNTTRLPREAFRFGAIPYLVVYSVWLLLVGLATTLLQLAMGQLSEQDPIGVWRAVPILRGVGHIQLLTSYIACIYSMVQVALAAAYMMWIWKDTFPLRACTKLQMTLNGYENKINASECFSITFLSPFDKHPQYVGIMAIIIFALWFLLPLLLYGLKKSYKVSTSILTPLAFTIAIILATCLCEGSPLESLLLSCEQLSVLTQPQIWFSALIQAMMSIYVMSGYFISTGGSVYKHSDVRWVAFTIIFYNLIAGWLWVLLWQSISGNTPKEEGFLSILILIYQSSIADERNKLWPILAFALIFISGIITILTLLYPIFDRLQRFTGDKWKLVAGVASAAGTCFTMGVLFRVNEVASVLDELVVPILVVFATTLQVIGFVFIYGCRLLRIDVEFLTGIKTSYAWVVLWWLTPILLIGFTGWWLRVLLHDTYGHILTLWPVGGTFIMILMVMAVIAAIAVAKEEQFNLFSKIAAAFRSSRLWGPEDPTIRYNWMLQRYTNDRMSNEAESVDSYNYPNTITKKVSDKHNWVEDSDIYQRNFNIYTNYPKDGFATYALPKKKVVEPNNFMSPNICLAKDQLDSRLDCNCNRHFTLNVPYTISNEVTTSL